MTETDKDLFSAEAVVGRYLQQELNGGDPARVRRAQKAQEANRTYGIGNWCWGGDLGMIGWLLRRPVSEKVIPLGPRIK